jgi:hypothetical protein
MMHTRASALSKPNFEATIEIIFENNLPNGPYGEMSGMGGKIYVPPSSYYSDVETAILDAWKKSRGSMANMRGRGGTYTEDWKVVKIEYKGGAVSPTDISTEGPHNVSLSVSQSAGPQCFCAIM